MTDPAPPHRECFGDLETVFPMGADGLRHSPETCLACAEKTECLRKAMRGASGGQIREEVVDRAYQAGVIGFLERWSRKKALFLARKNPHNQRGEPDEND